ncbi:MAG: class I SAM-dependent methyltransferase [Anaerolineaceae bacterium]|nr:class I SAM-dependent methyltransferase [Anaerolineaceae bacterium]
MAQHNKLYKKAIYYDVVFDRNVSSEVKFLLDVFELIVGREAVSIIELACGPGYHSIEAARLGLQSFGLDLNPEMIDLGKQKAEQAGLSVTWLAQDFRDFHLPNKVDLAINIFDGLDALLTNEDLIAHFKAVAQNLNDNGLYIIDLSHPRDFSVIHYQETSYQGARDGVSVRINWAINHPKFDLVSSVADVEVAFEVNDHGEKVMIMDHASERMLLPQEISLLADLSNQFLIKAWHGNFQLDQPFDNTKNSKRMIIVMQKITA